MKEIIHDGNIYYVVPCKYNCGIKWLTIDELDNRCCSDCEVQNKSISKDFRHKGDK